MHKDVYHPQVKKDVKKLDVQVKKEIQDYHINMILKDTLRVITICEKQTHWDKTPVSF